MERKRGRPRKFDESKVTAAIIQEFWEKGFAATSLDDLAKATGLTRPSLYGAYGNKLSMYVMAINLFGELVRNKAGVALANSHTIEAALTGFFTAVIDIYLGENDNRSYGCLVHATAVTEAVNHPEIQQNLQKIVARQEQAFTTQIARIRPDISDLKRQIIVDLSVSTLHSLAIRARLGTPRSELLAFVKNSISGITAVEATD